MKWGSRGNRDVKELIMTYYCGKKITSIIDSVQGHIYIHIYII